MIRYLDAETLVGFTAPDRLMTLNDRQHWAPRAKRTAIWRHAAGVAAHGIRPQLPSIVTIELPVIDRRRRDPHNYTPTMKACIDGLVDAGAWPDDHAGFIVTCEPVLIVDKVRPGFVTLRLAPIKPQQGETND